MWIRSQNGKSLSDCNSFAVESFFEQHKAVTLNNRSGISVVLGVYSSEEKALKVLDEIQDYIEDAQNGTIDDMGRGCFALNKRTQIYEMPQDEEVEV